MALVSLFKTQLENESSAIATARNLTKRGDYLIWWYFSKIVGLTPEDIESVICDGFNDLGIDAIWIEDASVVHFYNFKNPMDLVDSFPSGEVDKMLAGLNLILSQRVEEILQIVPTAYRIHLVTSGTGMSNDSKAKLAGFIEAMKAPSSEWFTWTLEDLRWLQDTFYQKTLPTIEDAFELLLDQSPYLVRSANHDCYMFHLAAERLAELYGKFGEQLLQQNIRVYQGDKVTNAVIRKTAVGAEAEQFFHYHNGITFLSETAGWDGFVRKFTLKRFQVVNGGQTMRVLHQAWAEKELRSGVSVPVRVITSQGDKEFANNVTVNLNDRGPARPCVHCGRRCAFCGRISAGRRRPLGSADRRR